MPTDILVSVATPVKSINLYPRGVGARHVSNHSLSRTSAEWQQVEQNQTAGQDVTPPCILFNNLPQRQVCGNPCYHGTVNCCMQWKQTHQTKPRMMLSYSNIYRIRGQQCQWKGKSPRQAIPPELFITAKVHNFHLQRQGFETNLPGINQFAFFL